MKMQLAVILLLSFYAPQQCTKNQAPTIPDCIAQKIDSLKTKPKANPPAEVHQYVYNGKTVYLLISGCCDQYNTVYDEHCNYICAPSGGITGKGDLQCTDFTTKAQHIKLVWKDER
jgi:hypothetical protein